MERNAGNPNRRAGAGLCPPAPVPWRWRAILILWLLAGLGAATLTLLPTHPASVSASSSATCCSDPNALSSAPLQELAPDNSLAPQASPADPPGTIDGAKTPELIPDEVAWRLLLLAVAEPENSTDQEKARARAKIAAAALSEEDADTFLRLLTEFRYQLDALDSEMAEIYARTPLLHPDSTDFRQLVELGKRRDQVFANTIAASPARLSMQGMEKIGAHLEHAKRGMKVIPAANESLMPPY